MNRMVRGEKTDHSIHGPIHGPWRKKNNNKEIPFKIYNPGILLFLKIEFGAEFG